MNINSNIILKNLEVDDLRWPTSLGGHGSDAMHTDPDYSCVYVTIKTNYDFYGNGLTFTCGRGTEVVLHAVNSLKFLVEGRNLKEIVNNFAKFWRELTSESQLRWIGPEKGVIHLAVAAIINAIWDLWAKIENKPVWRLLVDLTPEELVSVIDFRYITDLITPKQATELLKESWSTRDERIIDILENGYPAYTTQVGWMGYSDEKIESLCNEYLQKGFTAFKVKVGKDLKSDITRCRLVRKTIGWQNKLMIDANQIWDVNEAIDWVKNLAEFKPLWIEEPTSPDDILGHAAISRSLKPLGIGVATGEMCANRIMFKQFLQANAMQYCQIDSARIGGINEILSVYLMAKKLNIKVCPHAGGIGLCEMVQHLQIWDFISLSATKKDRVIEYIDQQHEQFINPCVVKNGSYIAPTAPGYNTELKQDAIENYRYPEGEEWQKLFNQGLLKELVSVIDFRYITDLITPKQATELLKESWSTRDERIIDILENGYPAYTTQVGWMGYSDEKIESLCNEYLQKGFTAFKVKVGKDLKSDITRCRLVRKTIGWQNKLMIDANQIWDVNEAIDWVKNLAEFKPLWIEEPTSPDDILGHAAISRSLKPLGIGVATGEMCANRIMFKQFLQANAMQYCQIDSARIGGINEILSVYLMAKKLNIKVCPHAGGIGLCEMVQHLQIWDFISLSATKKDRVIEYIDQQHEQFINPCVVKNGSYIAPTAPGYNTELKQDAIENYRYPEGEEWQKLFNQGLLKVN